MLLQVLSAAGLVLFQFFIPFRSYADGTASEFRNGLVSPTLSRCECRWNALGAATHSYDGSAKL